MSGAYYSVFATNVYIGIAYALGILTGIMWVGLWRAWFGRKKDG